MMTRRHADLKTCGSWRLVPMCRLSSVHQELSPTSIVSPGSVSGISTVLPSEPLVEHSSLFPFLTGCPFISSGIRSSMHQPDSSPGSLVASCSCCGSSVVLHRLRTLLVSEPSGLAASALASPLPPSSSSATFAPAMRVRSASGINWSEVCDEAGGGVGGNVAGITPVASFHLILPFCLE